MVLELKKKLVEIAATEMVRREGWEIYLAEHKFHAEVAFECMAPSIVEACIHIVRDVPDMDVNKRRWVEESLRAFIGEMDLNYAG